MHAKPGASCTSPAASGWLTSTHITLTTELSLYKHRICAPSKLYTLPFLAHPSLQIPTSTHHETTPRTWHNPTQTRTRRLTIGIRSPPSSLSLDQLWDVE
mmetsp:Transcript_794/g.1488  ORF Transcript_794/g.1488 Transcript_794/m.1488 type:complete len:100 (+) Transcript_794:53-352(+)